MKVRIGATKQAEPMQVRGVFSNALQHHQAGRLNKAERLYRRILTIDPRNSDSLHMLGVIAFQRLNYDLGIDLIEQAISINPAVAPYHFHLGNILRDQGRPKEAAACYRRALDLDADFAEAHNNLGVVLRSQNDLEGAVVCYRRVLELKPSSVMAHSNLGRTLKDLGRLDEAIVCFRRVLDFEPHSANAHNDLGAALDSRGLLEEAAACYERALEIDPKDPGAQNNLGVALYGQGRFDDATSCYLRALELKPDYPGAFNNLGIVLRARGRFGEAIAAHEKAITLGTDPSQAYYGLSGCRKFTERDDPLIAAMEAAIKDSKLTHDGQSLIHFALGKIYDDLAQYETAIQHIDEANRLELKIAPFDMKDFVASIDWLIDQFPNTALKAHIASDSELPIFIVGMPRSGTTLIEQILARHSEIAAGGELRFWAQRSNWVKKQSIIHLDAATEQNTIHEYLGLLTRISSSSMRVTDKMPYNFFYLGLVHRLFPKARFIHCRRAPIDTALSLYFNRFTRAHDFTRRRSDIVVFSREYCRLMDHWREVLPPDQFIEIDYEHLVTNQESISRRLLAFCGIGWEDTCLDFHEAKNPISTGSAWQARQPIYRTSIGRWRNYEPWLGELRELLRTARRR